MATTTTSSAPVAGSSSSSTDAAAAPPLLLLQQPISNASLALAEFSSLMRPDGGRSYLKEHILHLLDDAQTSDAALVRVVHLLEGEQRQTSSLAASAAAGVAGVVTSPSNASSQRSSHHHHGHHSPPSHRHTPYAGSGAALSRPSQSARVSSVTPLAGQRHSDAHVGNNNDDSDDSSDSSDSDSEHARHMAACRRGGAATAAAAASSSLPQRPLYARRRNIYPGSTLAGFDLHDAGADMLIMPHRRSTITSATSSEDVQQQQQQQRHSLAPSTSSLSSSPTHERQAVVARDSVVSIVSSSGSSNINNSNNVVADATPDDARHAHVSRAAHATAQPLTTTSAPHHAPACVHPRHGNDVSVSPTTTTMTAAAAAAGADDEARPHGTIQQRLSLFQHLLHGDQVMTTTTTTNAAVDGTSSHVPAHRDRHHDDNNNNDNNDNNDNVSLRSDVHGGNGRVTAPVTLAATTTAALRNDKSKDDVDNNDDHDDDHDDDDDNAHRERALSMVNDIPAVVFAEGRRAAVSAAPLTPTTLAAMVGATTTTATATTAVATSGSDRDNTSLLHRLGSLAYGSHTTESPLLSLTTTTTTTSHVHRRRSSGAEEGGGSSSERTPQQQQQQPSSRDHTLPLALLSASSSRPTLTPSEQRTVQRLMRRCHLFAALERDERVSVARRFGIAVYAAGAAILEQGGDSHECLFLIADGTCETIKNGKSLGILTAGATFGELEMMYTQAKCAATVRSVTRCTLFTLPEDVYHRVVLRNTLHRRARYEALTAQVPFLRCLPDYERLKIAEALTARAFVQGDYLVRFGSTATQQLYFIIDGEVAVVGRRHGRDVEVLRLHSGDVVGELEFLFNHPAVADVVVTSSQLATASITRSHLELILGPIHDRLKAFIATSPLYASYYRAEAANTAVRGELARVAELRQQRPRTRRVLTMTTTATATPATTTASVGEALLASLPSTSSTVSMPAAADAAATRAAATTTSVCGEAQQRGQHAPPQRSSCTIVDADETTSPLATRARPATTTMATTTSSSSLVVDDDNDDNDATQPPPPPPHERAGEVVLVAPTVLITGACSAAPMASSTTTTPTATATTTNNDNDDGDAAAAAGGPLRRFCRRLFHTTHGHDKTTASSGNNNASGGGGGSTGPENALLSLLQQSASGSSGGHTAAGAGSRHCEDAVATMPFHFSLRALAAGGLVVIGLREDGLVFYWNDAAVQLTGYAAADVVGQNIYSLLLEEHEQTTMYRAIADARAYAGRVDDYFTHMASRHTRRRHGSSQHAANDDDNDNDDHDDDDDSSGGAGVPATGLPLSCQHTYTLACCDGLTRASAQLLVVPPLASSGDDAPELMLLLGTATNGGCSGCGGCCGGAHEATRLLDKSEWLVSQLQLILGDVNVDDDDGSAQPRCAERLRLVAETVAAFESTYRAITLPTAQLRVVNVRQLLGRVVMDAGTDCVASAISVCQRFERLPSERAYLDVQRLPECLRRLMRLCIAHCRGSHLTLTVTTTEKCALEFLVINYNVRGARLPCGMTEVLPCAHCDTAVCAAVDDDDDDDSDNNNSDDEDNNDGNNNNNNNEEDESSSDGSGGVPHRRRRRRAAPVCTATLTAKEQQLLRAVREAVEQQGGTLLVQRDVHNNNLVVLLPYMPADAHDVENASLAESLSSVATTTTNAAAAAAPLFAQQQQQPPPPMQTQTTTRDSSSVMPATATLTTALVPFAPLSPHVPTPLPPTRVEQGSGAHVTTTTTTQSSSGSDGAAAVVGGVYASSSSYSSSSQQSTPRAILSSPSLTAAAAAVPRSSSSMHELPPSSAAAVVGAAPSSAAADMARVLCGCRDADRPAYTFTTLVAEDVAAHRNMLCAYLWERKHAVLPAYTVDDIDRLAGVADILFIDPSQSLLRRVTSQHPLQLLREKARHMAVVVTSRHLSEQSARAYHTAGLLTLRKPCTPLQAMQVIRRAEDTIAAYKREAARIAQMRDTLARNSRGAWRRGRLLGKGTYSEVYEAIDVLTGGTMAVKEMQLHKNNLQIEHFVNEIATMCSLQHPNIIHYFYCEQSTEQKVVRVFMEYAAGGTLQTLLQQQQQQQGGGTLSFKQLQSLLRDVTEGIAYIHAQHYVHSDIKTANVLLSADGVGKIGDFGTARRVKRGELLYEMRGSPLYMSPECMSAGDIDERGHRIGYSFATDIWSLGCVALEMITGRPPFAHLASLSSPAGLTCYITSLTDTPDLSAIFDARPCLVEFVSACLAPNPAQRATARELLHFSVFDEGADADTASALQALQRVQLLHVLNQFVAFREPSPPPSSSAAEANNTTPRRRHGRGRASDSDDSDDSDSGDDTQRRRRAHAASRHGRGAVHSGLTHQQQQQSNLFFQSSSDDEDDDDNDTQTKAAAATPPQPQQGDTAVTTNNVAPAHDDDATTTTSQPRPSDTLSSVVAPTPLKRSRTMERVRTSAGEHTVTNDNNNDNNNNDHSSSDSDDAVPRPVVMSRVRSVDADAFYSSSSDDDDDSSASTTSSSNGNEDVNGHAATDALPDTRRGTAVATATTAVTTDNNNNNNNNDNNIQATVTTTRDTTLTTASSPHASPSPPQPPTSTSSSNNSVDEAQAAATAAATAVAAQAPRRRVSLLTSSFAPLQLSGAVNAAVRTDRRATASPATATASSAAHEQESTSRVRDAHNATKATTAAATASSSSSSSSSAVAAVAAAAVSAKLVGNRSFATTRHYGERRLVSNISFAGTSASEVLASAANDFLQHLTTTTTTTTAAGRSSGSRERTTTTTTSPSADAPASRDASERPGTMTSHDRDDTGTSAPPTTTATAATAAPHIDVGHVIPLVTRMSRMMRHHLPNRSFFSIEEPTSSSSPLATPWTATTTTTSSSSSSGVFASTSRMARTQRRTLPRQQQQQQQQPQQQPSSASPSPPSPLPLSLQRQPASSSSSASRHADTTTATAVQGSARATTHDDDDDNSFADTTPTAVASDARNIQQQEQQQKDDDDDDERSHTSPSPIMPALAAATAAAAATTTNDAARASGSGDDSHHASTSMPSSVGTRVEGRLHDVASHLTQLRQRLTHPVRSNAAATTTQGGDNNSRQTGSVDAATSAAAAARSVAEPHRVLEHVIDRVTSLVQYVSQPPPPHTSSDATNKRE